MHLVSHRNGFHGVLALQPERDGAPVDTTWSADPAIFRWASQEGAVEAAFAGRDAIRLRGNGLGLRITDAVSELTPFSGAFLFTDPSDDALVFTSYETGCRYRVTVLRGARAVEGCEDLGAATRSVVLGSDGAGWEAEVREVTSQQTTVSAASTFAEVVADSAADFADYLEDIASWRDPSTPAAALAAYVLWSATVAPSGFVTRESVLMSKHWMDKLWSWDHCFNAMALSPGRTDAAIDQFLAPFDHQDECGALPDSVTHSEILYNYVKPPIHGWALQRVRATATRELTVEELGRIHDCLARWSRFWLDSRRRAGHVLPYYQHGNDSGWDNSTTFDVDRVIESPDLAAFLALQLDVLADLSDELGRPSTEWRESGDLVVRALLDQLWTGTEFIAVGALSGRPSTATSLLNLLPLVLGDRLPHDVRSAMADRLQDHLTDARPRHRAGVLPAVRGRRLLARPDLGTVHSHRRGRPATQRVRSPRRRGQRPFPRLCETLRLRRELRRRYRCGPPGPRLHVDRRGLPPLRRGSRPANELTAGITQGPAPRGRFASRRSRSARKWRSAAASS